MVANTDAVLPVCQARLRERGEGLPVLYHTQDGMNHGKTRILLRTATLVLQREIEDETCRRGIHER